LDKIVFNLNHVFNAITSSKRLKRNKEAKQILRKGSLSHKSGKDIHTIVLFYLKRVIKYFWCKWFKPSNKI